MNSDAARQLLLARGGELGELIVGHDWSATALGPIAQWPQSLVTTIALLLGSPLPIVTLWGEDGVMIYNDAYSVFAGGRHPGLLGSNVREGWPEVAAFNDRVMATVLGGGTLSFRDQELTLVRNGTPEQVWMNLDYSPVLDESGKPAGVIAFVVETTGKVQAERAVRESEAQFRSIAQAMPNHVWSARPDGQLDWFNHRVYDYSGAASGSLDGARWAEIVHPDDRDAAAARWGEALATGDNYEVEFRIRGADDSYRWHITRATAIRNPEGEITRWIGTNTDIEDQKAASRALAHLNETLEQQVAERTADRDRMWRLSTDVMLVADFEGRIAAVNPAWARLFGWSDSETLGTNFLDLVHPDDLAPTVSELGQLAQGVTTLRFENRYRAKDGNYVSLSWTAVPDSALIHAVGRDMTAEKAANEELEQAQEALRQSQKMEAVGQLTGGIAHDFNNLLTGIIGSLDMMKRKAAQGKTEDVERYATAAMTSANRAAALTHRLLAFSRRQPLDPKPVNANQLVTGMEDLLRRSIGEGVRLEMVTAGGLWQTRCDPHQLENSILNLAINARDAMPTGGVLTIETCNAHLDTAYAATSRGVRPGQYVCICVTDTGVGMSADVIAKAFEPFFTTKPMGQGTGLGLSMIYGFARQSEGYSKIYSEVGKGTTFKLYLPRHFGDGESAQNEEEVEHEAPRGGDGETVLVVEDEAAVRALVVDVLGDLGYRTLEAEDGLAGLRIVQSDVRIDLLITDVGLPGLNGRQVADAARAKRPELKILFMTGYAENAAIAGGFLEPGMEMVTKPFAIEALGRRIRGMFDGADSDTVDKAGIWE
jgi:PAS domain S-box-containing protein